MMHNYEFKSCIDPDSMRSVPFVVPASLQPAPGQYKPAPFERPTKQPPATPEPPPLPASPQPATSRPPPPRTPPPPSGPPKNPPPATPEPPPLPASPQPATSRPLTPRALYQDVAERLRQQIFNRELEPAAWIDEQKLALEFGISRTPLREALKVL